MATTIMAEAPRTGAERAAGLSDASLAPPTPREASAGRPLTGHEWFVLDIPRPPSVNSFMKRLGNRSPNVVTWIRDCDVCLMLEGKWPRFKGPFEIIITWDAGQIGRFDWDNPIKPLMDWLQRIEMIENDKLCRRALVEWGEAPEGCRIRVRAWGEAS